MNYWSNAEPQRHFATVYYSRCWHSFVVQPFDCNKVHNKLQTNFIVLFHWWDNLNCFSSFKTTLKEIIFSRAERERESVRRRTFLFETCISGKGKWNIQNTHSSCLFVCPIHCRTNIANKCQVTSRSRNARAERKTHFSCRPPEYCFDSYC